MYKSYKLVMFILNVKGGESETVEHLYHEVDGTLVPMNENEAILEMLSKTAKIGGNPATQIVKSFLFNPNGDNIKIESSVHPIIIT